MLDRITSFLKNDIPSLTDSVSNTALSILNSNFSSAMAGALFGAIAASRIASRSKDTEETRSAIRSLNTALVMAISSMNSAGGIMLQSSRPMKEKYEKCLSDFDEHKRKYPRGSSVPFDLGMDLLILPPANLPTVHLQSLVLGCNYSPAKAISLVFALEDAVTLYNSANDHRNQLLKMFKSGEFPKGYTGPDIYLAQKTKHGINSEYKNNLVALYTYNNDMIYYSMRLTQELQKAIESIIKKKKIKGVTPPSLDYSDAESKGLIPDSAEYKNWEMSFQDIQKKPGIFKQTAAYLKQKITERRSP